MSVTIEDKQAIIILSGEGKKPSQIAKKLKASVRTIQRIIKRQKEEGTTERKKGSGGPRKLSERDLRTLERVAKHDRRATLQEITNQMPMKVHSSTIRSRLHELGLQNRIAKKKPFLKDQHIQQRKNFASNQKNWSLDDWRKVIWTDESSFETGKNSRQIKVWRSKHEVNELDCLAPTFKSDRSSIMVWGAITYGKKSNLVVMDKGKRTAVHFVEQVYERELGRFWATCDEPILMEDGAPVHRSNAPQKWREENGIVKMDWPAQSPDLNPIENLWKQMKDRVQKKLGGSPSKDSLEEAIREAWEEIPISSIDKLVDSMPERLAALKKVKGKSTRW
jgi:transposase